MNIENLMPTGTKSSGYSVDAEANPCKGNPIRTHQYAPITRPVRTGTHRSMNPVRTDYEPVRTQYAPVRTNMNQYAPIPPVRNTPPTLAFLENLYNPKAVRAAPGKLTVANIGLEPGPLISTNSDQFRVIPSNSDHKNVKTVSRCPAVFYQGRPGAS